MLVLGVLMVVVVMAGWWTADGCGGDGYGGGCTGGK